jgi:galactokinase
MIICNTMVKHGHSGGEYNDRREQCEEGVRILQRSFPSIIALRDLSLAQLDSQRSALSPLTFRRCHHVITENLRVLRFVKALQSGNLKAIGECMAESHLSLKNDYEVSCRELDIMVEIAAQQPAVIGSRMTGGGFGGCTINLVRTDAAEGFKQRVAADYRRATQIEPEIYVSSAGAGVSEIVESVQHHDRI